MSFISAEEDLGLIGLEAIQTDSRADRTRTILIRAEFSLVRVSTEKRVRHRPDLVKPRPPTSSALCRPKFGFLAP